MRMNLDCKPFLMLEQPDVQSMQFASFHTDAQTIRQSVSSLLRHMHSANKKYISGNSSTPEYEALMTTSSSFAQLRVRLVADVAWNNKMLKGLERVHRGAGPKLKPIFGMSWTPNPVIGSRP